MYKDDWEMISSHNGDLKHPSIKKLSENSDYEEKRQKISLNDM